MDVVSWQKGADNKLEIVGLTNTLDGTNPADATVSVIVRTRAGVPVTGLNGVAMSYVAGTTGANVTYRLTADDSVVPPIGLYEAEATATRAGVTGKKFAVITVEKQ